MIFWNDYTPDYVAIVATQAAILSRTERPDAPSPKPPLKDCPQCKGTGRVKTGDGQNWTNCPCTERKSDSCPDGECKKER